MQEPQPLRRLRSLQTGKYCSVFQVIEPIVELSEVRVPMLVLDERVLPAVRLRQGC